MSGVNLIIPRQEDERRLRALYQELKEKGLSKAEVEAAIKRERRVAEKALQRSKKLVCFKVNIYHTSF